MHISRRDMLTAGVSALAAATAPRALAGWEPSDRYPDPAKGKSLPWMSPEVIAKAGRRASRSLGCRLR